MGRRLSLRDIAEIRYAIDIENGRVKKKGLIPKGPQIVLFSCECNCFSINVLTDSMSQSGLYKRGRY